MIAIMETSFLIVAAVLFGIFVVCSIACAIISRRHSQEERYDAEDRAYQEFDRRFREEYKKEIDSVAR